ncbi:MAG: Recombination protein RecR [Candidatus Azambacteria bacterium GW2011_GWD2_46_48]|uniref:Recombination protein RecR n=1 Tax=Candidatus Azambacteria bacterium GW2011_GWD2_46_48 TaxID=1618623 RepID=A0A0G1Q4S3_9BACT|nr:MAG: Recombination protein RecR [Candidatus Azambacteria bacterium GW2011_GWD2_46_48]
MPSIGPRQASRLAFHLLKKSTGELQDYANVILALHQDLNVCAECFYVSGGKDKNCEICNDPERDQSVICVVEKETDTAAIEKTGRFKGLYHILGGTISKLEPESYKKLRVKELFERIKTSQKEKTPVKEAILALNPTLERVLKATGVKITRLGRGLPSGADMEFADEETLGEALDSRKEMKTK